MIGEKDFWKDTSYVSLLLNKKGDFYNTGWPDIRSHMRQMKALRTGSIICICLIIILESVRQDRIMTGRR